jgi:hypothetical protein
MSRREELKCDTDHILQGIRIVLPGTQALMGFQFIAFFNPVFQSLPSGLKNLHFVALFLTILCSLLLIAPVAFQQIGEEGNMTDRFLQYTRKMLSSAMLCLLVAIAADVYLAAKTIGAPTSFAATIAIALFGVGTYLWYVYALLRRNHKHT